MATAIAPTRRSRPARNARPNVARVEELHTHVREQERAMAAFTRSLRAAGSIRKVLDSPAPVFALATPADDCERCKRALSSPFACDLCGYRGMPFVHGCSCVKQHETARAQATGDAAHLRSIGDVEEAIRYEAHADALGHLDETFRCTAHDDPASVDDCLHGLVECPSCGGGEKSYSLELIDPWGRLKAIRRAMENQQGIGEALVADVVRAYHGASSALAFEDAIERIAKQYVLARA